jgi:hypothetical protein
VGEGIRVTESSVILLKKRIPNLRSLRTLFRRKQLQHLDSRLDAKRRYIRHGRVQRQSRGDKRRAADEMRRRRIRRCGHARSSIVSPKRRRTHWRTTPYQITHEMSKKKETRTERRWRTHELSYAGSPRRTAGRTQYPPPTRRTRGTKGARLLKRRARRRGRHRALRRMSAPGRRRRRRWRSPRVHRRREQ